MSLITGFVSTGEAIPLRGLEGVPGLPGAPQDEAGLTRIIWVHHEFLELINSVRFSILIEKQTV